MCRTLRILNPLLNNIMQFTAGKSTRKKTPAGNPASIRARRYKARRVRNNLLRDAVLLTAGTLSAGFGLRGFLIPNHFIDGVGNRHFAVGYAAHQYITAGAAGGH
jgi:hypothetical protein